MDGTADQLALDLPQSDDEFWGCTLAEWFERHAGYIPVSLRSPLEQLLQVKEEGAVNYPPKG